MMSINPYLVFVFLLGHFTIIHSSCQSAYEYDNILNISSKMEFYLHTRARTSQFNLTNVDDLKDKFYSEKNTKILVHGWKNKLHSRFNEMLVDTYLRFYDVNVIVVVWSNYSGCTNYYESRNSVSAVGKVVAYMIDTMYEKLKLDYEKTHMIGFSLGAHVSGIAGLRLRFGRLSRVTGLDPAGPGFSPSDVFRLRNDSARFVDVIHSAMKAAGTMHRVGLADFYPNGGTSAFNVIKSHQRAYYYFNESIGVPGGFKAKRCDKWKQFKKDECPYKEYAEMGEHVSYEARGRFFLQTNKEAPFARFNLSLVYTNGALFSHGGFYLIVLSQLLLFKTIL